MVQSQHLHIVPFIIIINYYNYYIIIIITIWKGFVGLKVKKTLLLMCS